GLARLQGASTVTGRDIVGGTPAYMSPEQICGESVDARTDLFSVGVVLYELLTGRLPWSGDHEVAIAHAILHEDPITVRELAPEVPAELEHIVFKAMMKNVGARYQSAAEMADDLVRFRDYDRRRRAGEHEEIDLVATSDVFAVRRERFHAPMLGREREAAALRALHGEMRGGEGATVVLAGEAGVGKSRLLEESGLEFRREGSRVLVASCLYGGSASSYFPFAEAFRQYFALRGVGSATALQSFVLDRAPRLGGSLPTLNRFLRFAFAANGPTTEEELWEVLDQLASFISAERPLVLAIEDLQWADAGSLRLFHFLARRSPRRRVLLLGTYRPEEAAVEPGQPEHPLLVMLRLLSREERVTRVELPRLGREQVDAIVAGLYPDREWGDALPALLYRETEGNPFFLVEILKLLVTEKVLVERKGRWNLATPVERISIPEKVYDVVMRRLSRLGAREREILELGAVEGTVFHSGTILRGLRMERMALLKALQFLEQVHHLIHATGPQYHFDHSKIREILYDSIPPELRIEYHTVVGQFLKESYGGSEEYAGIIAHNLMAAGMAEEALPFLLRAAEAAGRLFSHSDAVHYLDRAEAVLHDLHPGELPRERRRLLAEIGQSRGDHEYAAGHYPAALASYESALALAWRDGDREREADLIRSVGRIQYLLGRYTESRQHYDDAIRHYEALERGARGSGDAATRAHAARELGKLYFFCGDLERSRASLEEAVALARERKDDRLLAAGLNNLAGIDYQRGDLEAALQRHREALALREAAGDAAGLAQTHKNIGIVHYRLGENAEAAVHLEEGLKGFRTVGDRRGEAVTLRHLGNLCYEGGDHEGAKRHWEASLFLCRQLGNTEDLAACLNNLGNLHLEHGRYATSDRHYREGIEALAPGAGKSRVLAALHQDRAELLLSLDQLGRAEEELALAEGIARGIEAIPVLADSLAARARIAAERGDFHAGRALASEALDLVEPTGHVENLVLALLSAAEVELMAGAPREAKRLARQSRDLARWSRAAYREARSGVLLARAAWKEGSRSEALAELEQLLPRAREGGYRALVARIHDLRGQIAARSGDAASAAEEFRRAAEEIREIVEPLSEEDRRLFLHHPDWKAAIGNLLETLISLGRREEALAYLVPLGIGAGEVEALTPAQAAGAAAP
ncbi:MAG TPA: tetratricopeptide repeat protein, partial [Candidatus Eisenbacteria bacterium]